MPTNIATIIGGFTVGAGLPLWLFHRWLAKRRWRVPSEIWHNQVKLCGRVVWRYPSTSPEQVERAFRKAFNACVRPVLHD